jgi:hypothetical protein
LPKKTISDIPPLFVSPTPAIHFPIRKRDFISFCLYIDRKDLFHARYVCYASVTLMLR